MDSSTSSDFDPSPTHRSLRHFPRDAPGRGLSPVLIIIIALSALLGGLLLTIFFWRILSRLRRPKSAPFPPRQALVHQRELQLAAFTEHKNASEPQLAPDDVSSAPASQGSDSALLPNARDWSANTPNRASTYTHETDEGAEVGLHLHPPSPQFFLSRTPNSVSSSSLPSTNDNSSPSSGAATPPTPVSTSPSPNQSFRRKIDRSGQPRPTSMVTIGTHMTARSRQSVRAAPHAPHSNVQIVLPAPLAPNLYEGTANEDSRVPRQSVRNSAHSDSWRRSLVDTWISVGQHEPEPMESRESMERRSRLTRSMSPPLSMGFQYLTLFPKEVPPRGHFLRGVDPTHHRSLTFIRLRDLHGMTFPKVSVPRCRACLLSLGHSLRPHGKDRH
jgi:hypothetical protein